MTEASSRQFAKSEMDTHFLALGRLAVLWASLEHEINSATWHLANVEQPCGACFTAQFNGPAPRLKAFIALVRQRGGQGDLLESLNKLDKHIRSLGAKRNRLIHDPWVDRPQKTYRLQITADRVLSYEWVAVDVGKIDATAIEVYEARESFMALYARALQELPKFPQEQFLESYNTFNIPGMDELYQAGGDS